jgi:hypothetical protein
VTHPRRVHYTCRVRQNRRLRVRSYGTSSAKCLRSS